MTSDSTSAQWRIIDGRPPGLLEYCREFLEYREVAYVLIRRDLIECYEEGVSR